MPYALRATTWKFTHEVNDFGLIKRGPDGPPSLHDNCGPNMMEREDFLRDMCGPAYSVAAAAAVARCCLLLARPSPGPGPRAIAVFVFRQV